jgi:hypothetical protein
LLRGAARGAAWLTFRGKFSRPHAQGLQDLVMCWMTRFGFEIAGLFFILSSSCQLRAGLFVFDDASCCQQAFTAGGIGIGVVFVILAFLPPRG